MMINGEVSNSRAFQGAILLLSDGRRITTVVPKFCELNDKIEVERVIITESRELPADCQWGPLYDSLKKEEHNGK